MSHPQPNDQRNVSEASVQPQNAGRSFAEVALRLGGKSDDEATRTGVLDSADDQVESMFAADHRTSASPIHRAVWDRYVPTELFGAATAPISDDVAGVINRSVAVVRKRLAEDALLDPDDKISEETLGELGRAGYWGLLVDPQYGGSGASMREFCRMITMMASVEPTVAGLASVHGCIGAVDPVRSFGTPEQQARFLPKLASGERLSAFALTEPGAGSDLTALRTTATRDGDEFVVHGEKLFITNATLGRTIGLVCRLDERPAVLIVDLPERESPTFRLRRYGLHALRRTHNQGLVFDGFRVPADHLLSPSQGDGLTIAYHGLNRGRVALCANAAGVMRWMLAGMLPWARYRRTYGETIQRRELVRRRIGRLAGRIVACDALTHWCAGLLDQGFRGEMECIVAKIFGSESQKMAAIEWVMKTHGGRSFLHGHGFGDNVHEFLAPCIYEGEGEMLGMAFFKSLVKGHGQRYFEPIGQVLATLGVRQPNPIDPRHLWRLRQPLGRYARWWAARATLPVRWTRLPAIDRELAAHARFARRRLSAAALRISGVMRRHQLKLADRQCRMSALSGEIQDAVVILVTSLYAAESRDPIVRAAADTVCRELRGQITGARPTDADFRQVTRLGESIAEQGWDEIHGIPDDAILMPYQADLPDAHARN